MDAGEGWKEFPHWGSGGQGWEQEEEEALRWVPFCFSSLWKNTEGLGAVLSGAEICASSALSRALP